MYYDYNTDTDYVDVFQLKRLPQFIGMTDEDIKSLIHKMNQIEKKQWESECKMKLSEQRRKDLAYIEEHSPSQVLPLEDVQIQFGVKITPDMGDDCGFVPEDILHSRKRTIKLSLDNKRKIYIR
jgi:hypothetical protein